jgi:hypothetical protein
MKNNATNKEDMFLLGKKSMNKKRKFLLKKKTFFTLEFN